MKANLTRSPRRRRPSLFLGFRAPSAAADSHAVTAPVLPVRRSSTLRLDLAQHRSRPAVPSAARRSRPAPVPAQSRRYSCHCRPPAAPPRPCTQPKTSAACPARVSPSSTPTALSCFSGCPHNRGKSNLHDSLHRETDAKEVAIEMLKHFVESDRDFRGWRSRREGGGERLAGREEKNGAAGAMRS